MGYSGTPVPIPDNARVFRYVYERVLNPAYDPMSTFFAVAHLFLFLFAVIVVYTWMSNDVKFVLSPHTRKT